MEVRVNRCVAWAPGLETPAQWREWAQDPALVTGEDKPAAKGVPAMTRRRLTRWGRQALEVAQPLAVELAPDTPVIFSSRHGDTRRTLKLLQTLAEREPLSPNAFSLSVHNAALGMMSILERITAPSLALAAGRDTLGMALIEAQTWLDAGHSQVLVAHTDEPLADFYAGYADEQEMPAAVGLLIGREGDGPALKLEVEPSGAAADERSMTLAFLAWWFAEADTGGFESGRYCWQWQCHGERGA